MGGIETTADSIHSGTGTSTVERSIDRVHACLRGCPGAALPKTDPSEGAKESSMRATKTVRRHVGTTVLHVTIFTSSAAVADRPAV